MAGLLEGAGGGEVRGYEHRQSCWAPSYRDSPLVVRAHHPTYSCPAEAYLPPVAASGAVSAGTLRNNEEEEPALFRSGSEQG